MCGRSQRSPLTLLISLREALKLDNKKTGFLILYFIAFDYEFLRRRLLCLPSATREQLRRRKSPPAPGEEARPQTDREVLVRGRSGKKASWLFLEWGGTGRPGGSRRRALCRLSGAGGASLEGAAERVQAASPGSPSQHSSAPSSSKTPTAAASCLSAAE